MNSLLIQVQLSHDIDDLYRGVLPHGCNLTAVGRIIDAVLSRILKDTIKLPNTTADEYHRLSELCRMLNALEGLFVEGPEHISSHPFSGLQVSVDVG